MTETLAQMICSVDECYRPVDRKGYCQRHYVQQWRHGSIGLVGPRSKLCSRCGEVYQPPNNRSVYCSEECRRGRSACLHCGAEFVVTSGSTGQFCSREHWYAMQRPTKTCPVCATTFRGQAKTCSRGCGYELRKRSHPARQSMCEQCGGAIGKDKKPSIRFCSRSCSMRARAVHGGVTLPDGSQRQHGSGYTQVKVSGRWVLEHRYVVEQQLGRVLEPHERVHHRNGRRDDNSPENLELWKVKGRSRKDPAGVRQSDYHCPGCRCTDH